MASRDGSSAASMTLVLVRRRQKLKPTSPRSGADLGRTGPPIRHTAAGSTVTAFQRLSWLKELKPEKNWPKRLVWRSRRNCLEVTMDFWHLTMDEVPNEPKCV